MTEKQMQKILLKSDTLTGALMRLKVQLDKLKIELKSALSTILSYINKEDT